MPAQKSLKISDLNACGAVKGENVSAARRRARQVLSGGVNGRKVKTTLVLVVALVLVLDSA